MRNSTPPSIPQQPGSMEHKPTKVQGGLPLPTMDVKPTPPPQQGGKKG